MGEFELLVFSIFSLFSYFKDEHLLLLKDSNTLNVNMIKKFYLDEIKILKKATKFYKNFHNNLGLSNLIVNYFNTK
jgi:hypothetical protein